MTVLDVTLVNVALPVLARDFGVSDSASVWIVTVYQLTITMLLLPLSSAGDLYSYRRNFLTGVVVFTLASAMQYTRPRIGSQCYGHSGGTAAGPIIVGAILSVASWHCFFS